MKLKLLFLCLSFLLVTHRTQAQKTATIADSVWADHLNELIKCASTDQITERISKNIKDSSYIAAFVPALRLSNSSSEEIKKEYNKVSYTCYLASSAKADEKLEKEYTAWYEKLKRLLSMWEVARLKNGDKDLNVPDDYFFTNSEDETAVRLDIVKGNGYHVRLRIF